MAALQAEVAALRDRINEYEKAKGAHPLGHYYSPVPSADDVARRSAEYERAEMPRLLPEIDLQVERQLERLAAIGTAIDHQPPFPEEQSGEFRYYYHNTQYGFNDGIMLHGMLRSLRPKRLIEIGSGFSSALILDTNERYLERSLACSFIEPYTERLEALIRDADRRECRIFASRVQDVDPGIFATLAAGDILFIDSSHVVKYGSDVEYILRAVLPLLAAGVFIHFHDIFYPFEYTQAFPEAGHYWNECYLLRAFLANNANYRIELFGDYIQRFYRDELTAVSPLCLKNTGGHLWISKTHTT